MKRRTRNPEAADRRGDERSPGASWLAAKRPILQFIAVFVVLILLFYGLFYRPPGTNARLDAFFEAYLSAYAQVSGWTLSLLGNDVTVNRTSISSRDVALVIVRGCDAMEATAMFLAAVLAFPVRWRFKWFGLALGLFGIAAVNLTRIVTLFYAQRHMRQHFEVIHIQVWQPAFVVIAIALWVAWALWATRPPKEAAPQAKDAPPRGPQPATAAAGPHDS